MILVGALAVRLGYLLSLRGQPPGELLLIDSETYDRLARLILTGGLKGEEAYAMNFLYPFFLAGTYAVAHGARVAALIAQAALDSTTCLIIYLAGLRLLDRGVAALAGATAALYAPLVFYAGAILTPTLVTFLAATTLLLLTHYQTRPRGPLALAAGLAAGLATLGRGNHLLLVPLGLVFFWLVAPSRKRALVHWLAMTLGLLLVLVPVTARNYGIERQWVPVAANYAAFYVGHNPGATGLYAMPSFTESARFESEVWGTREVVSKKLGRPVTLAESSRYLFREGLRYAIGHPVDELKLAARKFYFFWNRTESPTNLNYYFARDFSPLLRALPFAWAVVAPFALLGLWLSRRAARRFVLLYLFVALNLLTALLFFVSAEYRLPVIPALILLAASAAVWILRVLRERRYRALAPALVVLAIAFVFVNLRTPLLRAQSLKRVDYLNAGRLYLDRREYGKARAMLEKSAAIDPAYAPAYESLARLSHLQGNDLEAARLALQARRFAAGERRDSRPAGTPPGANYVPPRASAPRSGVEDRLLELAALYQAGRWQDALRGFEALRVEAQARGDSELVLRLLNNTGLCHYKMGDLASAEATFSEIIRRSPAYVKAYNNLGLVRETQGRPGEAVAAYRQALKLDPANVVARRGLERLKAATPPPAR
jgi:tetratricopeptide (TPR) repeat protein